MKCINCGSELEPDSIFCSNCGQKQPETERVFCGNCGAEILPGSDFCGNCGFAVNSGVSSADMRRSRKSKQRKKSSIIIVALLLIVLGLSTVIAGYVFYRNGDDADEPKIETRVKDKKSDKNKEDEDETSGKNKDKKDEDKKSDKGKEDEEKDKKSDKSKDKEEKDTERKDEDEERNKSGDRDEKDAEDRGDDARNTATPAPTPVPTPPPTPVPTPMPQTDGNGYAMYYSSAYGFRCKYPSWFSIEDNSPSYFSCLSSDGRARMYTSIESDNGLSPQQHMNNYIYSYNGMVDFQTSGSNYFAARVKVGNSYFYRYGKLKNGNVYYFSVDFPGDEFGSYDAMINYIYADFMAQFK